jgi:tRNA(fMet)-specific endonuclease VapC
MRYLLDTNTLIYFFRGQGRVAERMLGTPASEVAVSAITLFELRVGIAKSSSPHKRLRQLDDVLSVVAMISFGDPEARHAAEIRASLETKGMPIGPMDNLIAGTAKCHGATLVTRNIAEFGRVDGLLLEDWYGD